MIIDMRTYTYYPDTYRPFLKFYQEQGYAITSKHLGFNLGLFTASSGIVNRTTTIWTLPGPVVCLSGSQPPGQLPEGISHQRHQDRLYQ